MKNQGVDAALRETWSLATERLLAEERFEHVVNDVVILRCGDAGRLVALGVRLHLWKGGVFRGNFRPTSLCEPARAS